MTDALEPITGTPNSDAMFEASRIKGERNAAHVAEIVDANSLERATIAAIEAKVRHGYKWR